ncbi:metal ABC transporter substrate-binding protein [Anaerovibrio sp.]|uniref:metal ABC transporter substrate-binding protein n=1 Tax=Anaerovibrio sp. TaxID=1872532 RepID=UPI003F189101
MKKIIYLFTVITLLCTVLLTGCGQSGTAQKGDGSFRIVTSFYPVYIATANITKGVDGVEVVNMTKPQTGCLHDYQLTTDDMRTLDSADAFVANGAGMEAFLDKVIKEHSGMKVIDASKGIELLKDDEGENPHVWLSITDAIRQAENIASQLAEADPKHADAYKANAVAYTDKLKALQAKLHAELDSLPHRDIVTFHEAFPYFAKEFNLNIVKVIEREPGTEPTPSELQETIEEVNKLPVKVLFTEPQYSPSAAETISRETGAKIYSLDPVVTGEADDSALDAYITTMEKNAAVLKEALK